MQDRITQNSGIAFQKSARDQIITAAERAKAHAVEARYNFQDWFTQNTGIALQRSAREKMATAQDEAKAVVAKARDDTQDWFTRNTGIAVQRSARENIALAGNGVSRTVAKARDDSQHWFTQNTGTALQRSARENIFTATSRAKDGVVKARYNTQDWIIQNSGVALQAAAREKIAATGKEAQAKVEKFAQDAELSMKRNIEKLTMRTQPEVAVDSVTHGIVETPSVKKRLSPSVDPVAEQAMLFKREMEEASRKRNVPKTEMDISQTYEAAMKESARLQPRPMPGIKTNAGENEFEAAWT
eukprot:TRINITY_DN11302_c0_g1_i2.p2 TRINITY_DN11302_c0_g1~~TRINITY_DN11302_c0_g1_i2.p2  ORF type:complete len:300 (+),score=63.84 TRINITY_DN11302_c0_g1_i2:1000-1899(+)